MMQARLVAQTIDIMFWIPQRDQLELNLSAMEAWKK
jgi:hypothetical protein